MKKKKKQFCAGNSRSQGDQRKTIQLRKNKTNTKTLRKRKRKKENGELNRNQRQKTKGRKRGTGGKETNYRKGKNVGGKWEERAPTWQQQMTAGKEKSKALTCAFGPAVH